MLRDKYSRYSYNFVAFSQLYTYIWLCIFSVEPLSRTIAPYTRLVTMQFHTLGICTYSVRLSWREHAQHQSDWLHYTRLTALLPTIRPYVHNTDLTELISVTLKTWLWFFNSPAPVRQWSGLYTATCYQQWHGYLNPHSVHLQIISDKSATGNNWKLPGIYVDKCLPFPDGRGVLCHRG